MQVDLLQKTIKEGAYRHLNLNVIFKNNLDFTFCPLRTPGLQLGDFVDLSMENIAKVLNYLKRIFSKICSSKG